MIRVSYRCLARLRRQCLLQIVGFVDPLEYDPFVIYATSKTFHGLFDSDNGAWHTLWKSYSQSQSPEETNKNFTWKQMRQRCNEMLRTPILNGLQALDAGKAQQFAQSAIQVPGTNQWRVGTSLDLSSCTKVRELPAGLLS